MRSICFWSRSFTGVVEENPLARATDSIRLIYQLLDGPPRVQGAIAPSERERLRLEIINSGSRANLNPKPVQSPQAPWGLLKLNVRGSISGKLVLHLVQANCSENTRASLPSTWASTTPSPSRKAVSTDSATRLNSVSGRTIRRSTTNSM